MQRGCRRQEIASEEFAESRKTLHREDGGRAEENLRKIEAITAECAEKGQCESGTRLKLWQAGAQQAAPLPWFVGVADAGGGVGLGYVSSVELGERMWRRKRMRRRF